MPGRKVAVLASPRARMSGVAAVADLCHLANRYTEQVFAEHGGPLVAMRVDLITPNGAPVTFADGRSQKADAALDLKQTYDAVYVASFEVMDAAAMDRALASAGEIGEWLRIQRRAGACIAAAGEGVGYVAQAGLLDDGEAAAAPEHVRLWARRFPKVRFDDMADIVRWRGLITARAFGPEPALAARMLEDAFSQNLGEHLRRACRIVDDEPDQPPAVDEDEIVRRAQLWLRHRFAKKVTIPEMAAAIAISQKALTRRFKARLNMTPQAYLLYLRMEAAKRQLTHTKRRVERIATLVGYSDVGFFKEKFRAHTGMSPAAFRKAAATR